MPRAARLDWAALARTGQPIVLYMARRSAGAIAREMLAGGIDPGLPAAVIAAATTPRQRVAISTLARSRRRGRHGAGGRARDRRDRRASSRRARNWQHCCRSRARGWHGCCRPDRRRPALRRRQDHGDARAARGAAPARALRCAPRSPAPTTSTPASMPPRPARRASTSTAGRCRRRCSTRSPRRRPAHAELLVIEAAMGLFDGVAGAAGPQRRRRRPRRAVRPAGAAGARRLGAGAVGRRRRARLCGASRGGAGRGRDAQPGGQRTPSRRRRRRDGGGRAAGARRAAPRRRDRAAGAASRAGAGGGASGARRRCSTVSPTRRRGISISTRSARCGRGASLPGGGRDARSRLLPPPGQRIALARDAAFGFVYPHLLAGWREAGAEIVPFSPLADEPPPAGCDACWLPGGYPELHAGRHRRRRAVPRRPRPLRRDAAGAWRVRRLHGARPRACRTRTAPGTRWRACWATRPASPGAGCTLGYRRARLLADGPLGPGGTWLRGHEFHYATLAEPGTTRRSPPSKMRRAPRSAPPAAGAARQRQLLSRHRTGVIRMDIPRSLDRPPRRLPRPVGWRCRRGAGGRGAAGAADQAAGQPRPAGGRWRPGSPAGRAAPMPRLDHVRSSCSPATTASPRKASRPIRPR